MFAPIQLAPKVGYGNPRIGVTFQFLKTPGFDLYARGRAIFNTSGVGNVVDPLEVGIPALLRFADTVRIDTGALVPVSMGSKTAAGVNVPLNVSVQITKLSHLGVSSGFSMANCSEPNKTAVVPLGPSIGRMTFSHRTVG